MSDSGRAWTSAELDVVRATSTIGWDNSRIGQAVDRFPGEVDRARWALLGREGGGALLVVNGGRRVETIDPANPPGWMRRFFKETLGV